MNDNRTAACVQLYAALCLSLLLTRARRRGPVWGACVLLWLLSGQELPRHAAAGAMPASGAGVNEVSVTSTSGPQERAAGWDASDDEAGRELPGVRPRVRSLLCRELPPPRAPDGSCC